MLLIWMIYSYSSSSRVPQTGSELRVPGLSPKAISVQNCNFMDLAGSCVEKRQKKQKRLATCPPTDQWYAIYVEGKSKTEARPGATGQQAEVPTEWDTPHNTQTAQLAASQSTYALLLLL